MIPTITNSVRKRSWATLYQNVTYTDHNNQLPHWDPWSFGDPLRIGWSRRSQDILDGSQTSPWSHQKHPALALPWFVTLELVGFPMNSMAMNLVGEGVPPWLTNPLISVGRTSSLYFRGGSYKLVHGWRNCSQPSVNQILWGMHRLVWSYWSTASFIVERSSTNTTAILPSTILIHMTGHHTQTHMTGSLVELTVRSGACLTIGATAAPPLQRTPSRTAPQKLQSDTSAEDGDQRCGDL